MSTTFVQTADVRYFALEVNYEPEEYIERFELGGNATIKGEPSFGIGGIVNIARSEKPTSRGDVNYRLDEKGKEVAVFSLWVVDRDFELIRSVAFKRARRDKDVCPVGLTFYAKTTEAFVRNKFEHKPSVGSSFILAFQLSGTL